MCPCLFLEVQRIDANIWEALYDNSPLLKLLTLTSTSPPPLLGFEPLPYPGTLFNWFFNSRLNSVLIFMVWNYTLKSTQLLKSTKSNPSSRSAVLISVGDAFVKFHLNNQTFTEMPANQGNLNMVLESSRTLHNRYCYPYRPWDAYPNIEAKFSWTEINC